MVKAFVCALLFSQPASFSFTEPQVSSVCLLCAHLGRELVTQEWCEKAKVTFRMIHSVGRMVSA